PEAAALTLAALEVDVLGVNCSIGPAGTLDAIEEMAQALRASTAEHDRGFYLSAQPNAGLPTRVESRFLYVSTPRYFADYARRFAEAGVRVIGGCCGTTPAHITAMRAALADYLPPSSADQFAPSAAATTAPVVEAPARAGAVAPLHLLFEEQAPAPRTRL